MSACVTFATRDVWRFTWSPTGSSLLPPHSYRESLRASQRINSCSTLAQPWQLTLKGLLCVFASPSHDRLREPRKRIWWSRQGLEPCRKISWFSASYVKCNSDAMFTYPSLLHILPTYRQASRTLDGFGSVGISTAQINPYQNFGKNISATAYSFSK